MNVSLSARNGRDAKARRNNPIAPCLTANQREAERARILSAQKNKVKYGGVPRIVKGVATFSDGTRMFITPTGMAVNIDREHGSKKQRLARRQ